MSAQPQITALPIPPIELRRSVGIEDPAFFDNPHGTLAFGDHVPAENYRSVLDFGCGCGRIARQMLMQNEIVPSRYLGLDLYRPSINWCRDNLRAPGFEFRHLNAANVGFNPNGVRHADFGADEQFSLINAHSVFTHITEPDLDFYFDQCARRLTADGILRSTWFLFDKINFPMMQTFQNCLYINPDDLTNATIYDAQFVRDLYTARGLSIIAAHSPAIRGHQWLIYAKRGDGAHVEFQPDMAPTGLARPPASIG